MMTAMAMAMAIAMAMMERIRIYLFNLRNFFFDIVKIPQYGNQDHVQLLYVDTYVEQGNGTWYYQVHS